MKKMVGIGAALAVAVLSSAPFVGAQQAAPAAPAAAAAPAPAPKPRIVFKLKDGTGAEVSQDVLKGKKSLLVFSQTACSQCRSELAELNRNYESVAGKGNVFVVLVDVTPDRAAAFYTAQGYKMPVLFDPEFTIPPQVDVRVTPATVLVDGDLKVIENKAGYKKSELMELLGKM